VRTNSTRTLPTSSFDALLRLAKLDDSIQDALATRNKLAADLEALMQSNTEALQERDKVLEASDRLKTIDYAKKTVERQVSKARQACEEKRSALRSRRELMAEDLESRSTQQQEMETSRSEIPTLKDEHRIKLKAIQAQRRRITSDLDAIFPITPIPNTSLAFTIRDIHLPTSDTLDSENPEKLAASLGYVSHILLLLSSYLSIPLPYPVTSRSSTSTIHDPISVLQTKTNPSTLRSASPSQLEAHDKALRTYPLFPAGVPRFRFEYAVFLLNKNIQLLLEQAYNIRVLDIRHTLPNLKYLFYVATAGEGELPARKAGGIRGLMRDRAGGRRSESVDSRASGFSQGSGSTAVGSLRRSLLFGAVAGVGKKGA
jgi:UV radiation resistance-associated gene protein